MSPALNGSSAIQRFERSNAIEICNGITFDFYTGLPHIINACACLIKYLDNEPHADLHKGRWEWSRSKCRASSQGEAKRERATLQSEVWGEDQYTYKREGEEKRRRRDRRDEEIMREGNGTQGKENQCGMKRVKAWAWASRMEQKLLVVVDCDEQGQCTEKGKREVVI